MCSYCSTAAYAYTNIIVGRIVGRIIIVVVAERSAHRRTPCLYFFFWNLWLLTYHATMLVLQTQLELRIGDASCPKTSNANLLGCGGNGAHKRWMFYVSNVSMVISCPPAVVCVIPINVYGLPSQNREVNLCYHGQYYIMY